MHAGSLWAAARTLVRVGKAGAARKLAAAAAFGGGGLSVMGASAVRRCCAPRRRWPGATIGDAEGEPPDATGWYGQGRPGPAIKVALLGDSSRGRLRRRHGARTPRARTSPPASPRAPTVGSTCARSPSSAPRPATSSGRSTGRSADRAARRGDPGRRQRRHPLPAALGVGAAARGRRAPAAGGRRRGGRRHLPRPRHHRADRSPAAAGRPALVAPAGRRPDHRDRRGGRADRLAGLGARPGVRGDARAVLRPGPVPPLGGRLRQPGRGAAALGARRRRA